MPCKHQVRKPPKSAPGEAISGPTRYENPAKVRLVGLFQAPPGTKTPPKCAWWVRFKPDQMLDSCKCAPDS